MVFLVNIFLILIISFYAGIFCVNNRKSLFHLFLGFNLPFVAMILISWIYQAPWFWYVIQGILQTIALFIGIYFKESVLNKKDIKDGA